MQKVIGQIGIFMICAQAVMHFRPKEAYGKYLRLLFSIMILVQLLQPFTMFFFGESKLDLQRSTKQFQEMLDETMKTAADRAAATEEKIDEMGQEVADNIEIAPVQEIQITREDEQQNEMVERKGTGEIISDR